MMETLKKYWYIAAGLLVFLFMYMKKKPRFRRTRRRMSSRYNYSSFRNNPNTSRRYSSYSRPRMRMTRRRR